MLNLKKTAGAVLLVLGSSAAFAGTMGPVCTPGNVTVPCERTAWAFGVQALYLQTTGNEFAGATATPTAIFSEFDNDWNWGFKVEAAYHFNTGNDFNVNWYHLGNDETSHTFNFSAFGGGLTTLSVEPRWDAVNAEFGQTVDFSAQKTIRFHGGLQYARIKNDLRSVSGASVANAESKFDGVGPRIGADMSYDLGNGLAIYGNGASSLLVGDSSFSSVSNNAAFASTFNGSRTVIVPEFEAKLGAMYTHAMAQGDITIDAGYMWVDYLSAQTNVSTGNENDFALHGPYVGLKWVGNVV